MPPPELSIIIASFNSSRYLEDAVISALTQRDCGIEVLIVDDGSTDGSAALGKELADRDARVRFLKTERNSGPGGARNLGFAEAHGSWIGILDSDDLLHPARSRRLIDEATASGADLIADNLILFDDDHESPPNLFLDRRRGTSPGWIDLCGYLDETRMFGRRPNLGFLKPIFRREFLIRNSLAYDERLRVAEDDALIVACLRAGGRYRLVPAPLYFYRKHGSSITHRLAPAHADTMKTASDELAASAGTWSRAEARALARRTRAMNRAWAYTHVLDDLKRGHPGQALHRLASVPDAALLFRQAVAARFARAGARLAPKRRKEACATARPVAIVISRQRLSGAINGSSAYLLALLQEISACGYDLHLLQPTPAIFGRTPFFRLDAELAVFQSHRIRRGIRCGKRFVATVPRVWLEAARGILSRLAARVGVGRFLPERKAPYSVALPWLNEDLLYVVREGASRRPALIIADYAFSGEAMPYCLAPRARTAIVMHDLFSSRAAQFAEGKDSVAAIDRETELGLLGQAQAVIAIQQHEADLVRAHLPASKVILAQMPALPAPSASPGSDDSFLFVGSNTAPNVHGLQWFVEEVWPLIRRRRPQAVLQVAGSVKAAVSWDVEGVDLLGVVPDLAPLYEQAGVVVSPLLQGSGLKIKLVEALAFGKACVATGVTLQGVEQLGGDGVVLKADEAEAFAQHCIALASDRTLRQSLGAIALATAKEKFGARTVFRELRDWVHSPAA